MTKRVKMALLIQCTVWQLSEITDSKVSCAMKEKYCDYDPMFQLNYPYYEAYLHLWCSI